MMMHVGPLGLIGKQNVEILKIQDGIDSGHFENRKIAISQKNRLTDFDEI